jgi:alpha-tubulin suppressor-like RCC1 family protein
MAGVFRTLSSGLALAATLLALLAPGAAAARGQIGAWGDGSFGQLGDGARTERLSPVQVQGSHGAGAIAIAAGHSHSLALQDDGTVWAWGYDAYGELGDGTLGGGICACRRTAVQTLGLSGVTAISAGGAHSLALLSDGTVWAWGSSVYGELRDGTTGDPSCLCRTTPVQVLSLSGGVAISGGAGYSLALLSDGTVRAWGNNQYGQLGDGPTAARHIPVQVSGLSGVIAISGGGEHSLALKSDGTVWAWGWNYYGQLGNPDICMGSFCYSTSPVPVSGLRSAVAIAAGDVHSVAVLAVEVSGPGATIWPASWETGRLRPARRVGSPPQSRRWE